MTRVLHIIWGLETGGKERFLYRLVRRLDPKRFTNEVWALRARGEFYEKLLNEGMRVRFLNKRPGPAPGTIRFMRRAIQACAPDIVHVQDFTSALAGHMALAFRTHPPVVMTLHGGQADISWIKKQIHRQLMKHSATVTTVSESMARTLRDQFGQSITLKTILPGIDASAFDVAPSPAETRGDLGIPPEGPLIVSVMRLEPPKDPGLLVRAAQHVVRQSADCRFVIVGDGSQRSSLAALIRELRLESRVFLPGSRTDVPRILALADVGVLASRREGLPLAILEYMAAGKPVVATRVGGVGELVADGTTGYLVDAGDDKAMADRIVSLINNPRKARELGANGRALVCSRFNEETMTEAYAGLYETLSPPAFHA